MRLGEEVDKDKSCVAWKKSGWDLEEADQENACKDYKTKRVEAGKSNRNQEKDGGSHE